MMGDDEAVDVAQGGGGVEEGQLLFGLFVDEEKHLLGQQGEKLRLILVVQGAGGEQSFAQDAEGLLPHGVPIGGKALEQQSRHPLAPGGKGGFIFVEAAAVDSVVFQHGPHGGKRRSHHVAVGGGEQEVHLIQHLVQFPGGQPQSKPAQIFRDVLGDLRLAGLQGLAQLHCDLVAPVRGQHRGDGEQRGTGHPPDHYVLTDLDEVGKMGGDVENVGTVALFHLIQQVFHTHGLQDPWRGGFQIVQKYGGDGIRVVQQCPVGGDIQAQMRSHLGLKEQKRRADDTVGALHRFRHGLPLRRVGGEYCQQIAEQPQRRCLLGGLTVLQPPGGKLHQQRLVCRADPVHGQVQHRVQQGKRRVRFHGGGVMVVPEELRGKAGSIGVGALLQQRVRHGLGLVADHTGLPGRQPPVGMDQLLQIFRPQQERTVFLRARGDAGGQLLLIAGVKACQDAADQGGGLAADVAVGEHQKLIEKIQGLLLLGRAPVGEILFENRHIGPQPFPLLFTAGGLQDVGEELLPAQAVHQADVVIHRRAADGRDYLVRGHQCNVLLGVGRSAGGGEGGVHTEGDHVLLKVLEFFVNIAVTPPLGGIDVVQLAQNDIKGFPEGVKMGDLLRGSQSPDPRQSGWRRYGPERSAPAG